MYLARAQREKEKAEADLAVKNARGFLSRFSVLKTPSVYHQARLGTNIYTEKLR
jgi:hypothetical protein